MKRESSVVITEAFLDMMVNALTQLPYRDVVPVFARLAEELNSKENKPSLIVH